MMYLSTKLERVWYVYYRSNVVAVRTVLVLFSCFQETICTTKHGQTSVRMRAMVLLLWCVLATLIFLYSVEKVVDQYSQQEWYMGGDKY
jgi:hypothetical protein